MAQLSRPYQIALLALGLFAAVWFTALHRPGSGGASDVSAGSAPAAHAVPAKAASPSSSTPVYHGSAPGVSGLTRDIARAHGAVAQSEQNASKLQSKSAQAASTSASAPAAPTPATATKTSATATKTPATKTHATSTAKTRSTASKQHSATAHATHARAVLQAKLARELAQGKVLLLLFWNPHASDDAAVRRQLSAAAAKLEGRVAVHVALAGQVGQYTSVTREVQVYGTPTLLVVGRHGQTRTLTGLLDSYTIEQAVSEARHGAAKKQ